MVASNQTFQCLHTCIYIHYVCRTFRDVDDDDKLTTSLDKVEFKEGIRKYGFQNLDDMTITDVFRELDRHGHGKIDYQEFLEAIRV